jgi:hypothetical protein
LLISSSVNLVVASVVLLAEVLAAKAGAALNENIANSAIKIVFFIFEYF